MLVTGIERTKKGRFSVFCDGEFCCALHIDVFAASPIQVGARIDPSDLEQWRLQSEARITKDRALRLLSARAYTGYGLYRKLVTYTDEEIAAEAVARMTELGLVDDWDYARRYAADCMNQKGYSLARTRQSLGQKGIDRAVIDEVLAQRDDDPEPAIARILLKKYWRYVEMDEEKGRLRAMNGLLRLGYRHGDIRTVLENLLEDEDYYRYDDEDEYV